MCRFCTPCSSLASPSRCMASTGCLGFLADNSDFGLLAEVPHCSSSRRSDLHSHSSQGSDKRRLWLRLSAARWGTSVNRQAGTLWSWLQLRSIDVSVQSTFSVAGSACGGVAESESAITSLSRLRPLTMSFLTCGGQEARLSRKSSWPSSGLREKAFPLPRVGARSEHVLARACW